ncbi:MAG: hypothetical protein GY894_08655 [Planctomycetes bacterium]|nr:hypothetical protein [Planctomycetota bacterium]MCP4839412.1 hypothetical protein [Planctomycetota bacterium]
MFDFPRLASILTMTLGVSLSGCGNENDPPYPADTDHPTENDHDHSDPNHSHGAGGGHATEGPQPDTQGSGGDAATIRSVALFGATLEVSIKGTLKAGGELHVEITQTAGAPLETLRVWIGAASGVGSIKTKADAHDGYFHAHVAVPSPLDPEAVFWLETRTAKGSIGLTSLPLNH